MDISKQLDKIKDKLFDQIHSKNLVYNTCWEDPRCDRNLLQFNKNSEIVMISSAGCNALDYLLDDVKIIHCVDLNQRQNALLELKKAFFLAGSYDDLFSFFGNGANSNYKEIYKKVRVYLPDFASKYWDKKINYFEPKSKNGSFYYRGTSGTFARVFIKFLESKPKLYSSCLAIINAQSLEEQVEIYKKIEPQLLTPFVKWMMNRHLTMSLLGVPRAQRKLIIDQYPGGISGFLSNNLRHVFTELPMSDNYFWRLYITGKYTKECCPNYLKEEHFDFIRSRISRIKTYNTSVSNFLEEKPKTYSHFILLDHQDWLAAHNERALLEEWSLIFRNVTQGSKILMRSAALSIDFIPKFALDKLNFHQHLATKEHQLDRVGTYASCYLMSVI